MKKIIFILFATLAIASCDLLYNQDSDSFAPVNDISISAIETTPFAKRGEILTVGITVTNSGTSTIDEEFEILLNNQSEGVIIGSKTLASGLAPKDSIRVSYNWNTGNVTTGAKTLVAKHTFKDDNPANDSLQSTVTVSEPDIADIAVSEVRVPGTIEEGKIVDVEVDVKNIGNQDVNEIITIELEDLTDGKTIGTQKIEGGLATGDATTLTYSWDTQGYSIGEHDLSVAHDFADENSGNDTRTASITINGAPVTDIAVTSIEAPSEATQGDNAEVSVTVRNIGNKDTSEDFTVILRDRTDDKQIASKTISGLNAENTVVLAFIWETDEASIGDHDLSASHDFADDNTDNDTRKTSVTINEAPITDIAVTSLEAPSEATQGDNVELKMRIENQGNQDVDEALTLTLVDQNDGSTIDSKSISGGIDTGAEISVTFNWDTEGATPGNYRLTARHNLDDDNSNNDSKSIEIRIIEDIFLDIAITTIDAPDEVEEGDKATIEVTLQNLGNRDVNEDILVTLANQTENKTISVETLKGGLKIGSSKTLKFEWNTKRAREGNHTLTVSHNFSDENLTNNSRTFEIEVEDD